MSYAPNDRYPSRAPKSTHDEPRLSVVRPRRRHPETLFRGWGPRLFALALAASSIGLPRGNAQAAEASAPACSSLDRDAVVIVSQTPEYPELAKVQRAEGTAIVAIHLSAGGNLSDAAISKSSGNAAFDREALRVVRGSRFAAKTVHCQGVEADYLYEVDFKP